MGFEFPDDKNFSLKQPEPPQVYPINTMKIQSLDDVKVLLAVLGLAMTKEFAEEHNLTHLLDDNGAE